MRDHATARFATLRSEVDDPIGGVDHIEIMFDDQDASAILDQPLEGIQQFVDVVEMQSGGRLVEDEQRALAGGLRQMRRPVSRAALPLPTALWPTAPAASTPDRRRPAPEVYAPASGSL